MTTKMPKMLILLMVVGLAGLVAGCTDKGPSEVTPTPESTDTPCPTCPEPTPDPALCPEGTIAGEIDCSECHDTTEEYQPHVDGGDYCFNCHGSDPHAIHTGEGTIQLECGVCHGGGTQFKTGTQFQQEAGDDSTCVLCHSPQNPIEPTNPQGNLVTIHLERNKECTVCHTEELSVLHPSADPSG